MRKQRFQRVRQQFVKFLRILPERNDRTRNSLTTASVRGQPVKYITFLFKPLQSTAKLTGRVTIVCVDASPRPASFATLYSNLPSPSLCGIVRVPCGQNLVHLALRQQKKRHLSFSTRPPRSTLRMPPQPISPSARMPLFSATPSDSAVGTISAGSSGTSPAPILNDCLSNR